MICICWAAYVFEHGPIKNKHGGDNVFVSHNVNSQLLDGHTRSRHASYNIYEHDAVPSVGLEKLALFKNVRRKVKVSKIMQETPQRRF